jgi:hypothetical protein
MVITESAGVTRLGPRDDANARKVPAVYLQLSLALSLSHLMSTCARLPTSLLPRQWLTTKAPAAALIRRIATGSANGKIAAAGEAEVVAAAVVDPFSTASVRIRREIWGVRTTSE